MTDYNDSGQEGNDDERRAESEEFNMIVLGDGGGGYVNVHNVSRDDGDDAPDAHIHSVHVEDGKADGCSCPHAMYRDAHCKHQHAVEKNPLVLSSANAASSDASAATTGQQVATDGGTVVESDEDEDNEDRGTTEVGGCAACDSGFTTGGEKFCSPKCRERGEVDDTPL